MVGIQAVRCYAFCAALGSTAGLVIACKGVVEQQYLEQGLRHTALWVVSRGGAAGALIGLAAAAMLLAALSLWSRLMGAGGRQVRSSSHAERVGPLTCPRWAVNFAVLLGVLTAAGVLLAPTNASVRFGPAYMHGLLAAFVLLWAVSSWYAAFVAFTSRGGREGGHWSRLRSLIVLGVVLILAFLHIWVRVSRWEVLAGLMVVAIGLCWAAYRWLTPSSRVLQERFAQPLANAILGRLGIVIALLILAVTGALWGIGWAEAEAARADARVRGRNVIVIALDTVRADKVSLIAADERDRDVTPQMRDLLAAGGTVFANAISQAPWTLPAFASIFTGLYPAEHGAEHRWGRLAPNQLTLAEILREAGYRTIGVSSALYVTKASGMDQGFQVFDESQAQGQKTISSVEVTDRALRFLRTHRDEPFFAFIHYFDPHWVYRDHSGHSFADGYNGWLREPSQELKQDEFDQYVSVTRPRARRNLLDSDEMQYLWDLYDEEIAFTDTEIGRLLRYIWQAGLHENSLIVLVADHGEEFLERGRLGHGKTLYQELIHVPLVIVEPGNQSGSVCEHVVETRALFSTILGFLGVAAPQSAGHMAPLLPAGTRARGLARSETQVPSVAGRRHDPQIPPTIWLSCVSDGRWKLMKEHLTGKMGLFDLESDPLELHECSAEHPEEQQRLEQELNRLDAMARGAAPTRPVPEADAEQRRRLEALGYL